MFGASLGGLDPAGWKCSEEGEIKNGEPQNKDEEEEYAAAVFKHSQSLEAEDVLRMKVVAGRERELELQGWGTTLRGTGRRTRALHRLNWTTA